MEDTMMVRRFFRFLPALAVVAAGTVFLAGCRHGHCGWGGTPEQKAEKVAKRIASELDLNESQRAKLDVIKDDLLARKDDFRSLREGFHGLLVGQMRSNAVDQSAMNGDIEQREAKAKELRAFLVQKFAEFHAVLEPAQRERLAARMEKHMQDCR
jgi:Spy/CpxP family protein refolding chaperone